MFKMLLEGFRGNLFLICNQRDITMMSILIGSVKKKKKNYIHGGGENSQASAPCFPEGEI